jgi:hypothetical protein
MGIGDTEAAAALHVATAKKVAQLTLTPEDLSKLFDELWPSLAYKLADRRNISILKAGKIMQQVLPPDTVGRWTNRILSQYVDYLVTRLSLNDLSVLTEFFESPTGATYKRIASDLQNYVVTVCHDTFIEIEGYVHQQLQRQVHQCRENMDQGG